MAFTNSFRMERVYFERLKSMIDILKPYLNTETDEKIKSILENSIDDNGSFYFTGIWGNAGRSFRI